MSHRDSADAYERDAQRNLTYVINKSTDLPTEHVDALLAAVSANALLAISHRLAHLAEVLEKQR